MLKRLLLLAGLLSLVSAPVMASGTIPGISMTQQLDSLGKPLNGGKLYLIQAGTTSTPQNCYQDSGLTPGLEWPNPITLDSAGRIPQLFCADGSIKIRLTNAAGVQQLVADNLLVVGPSGGGGGGGTVDPTTIIATGDIKIVYGTGPITGFVRCNGRTIGSATSGANERANADTLALFVFLWNANPNLAVSGGRGASAAADFAANKTITLPDCRGRVIAGDDSMGNSPAGRLTDGVAGIDTFGDAGGSQSHTLTVAQIPSHNHTLTDPGHNHSINPSTFRGLAPSFAGSFAWPAGATASADLALGSSTTGISIAAAGGGAAHPIVQPTIIMTTYIKL